MKVKVAYNCWIEVEVDIELNKPFSDMNPFEQSMVLEELYQLGCAKLPEDITNINDWEAEIE